MKDAFYFPHDNNARNDDRILTIRAEFENEKGYAWYFWILESMAESSEGRLMRGALGGLELGLNVPAGSLKPFVERCIDIGLFEADEHRFWSPRMVKQKATRQAILDGASRGGKARWGGLAGGNAGGKAKERRGEERKGEKKNTPYSPPKGDINPQGLVELWNQQAHRSLPRVKELNKVREAKIRARLGEKPWKQNWQEVITRINASRFLTGQVIVGDRKPFLCYFDWILSPTNLTKIIEGNYDNRDNGKHETETDRIFDRLAK